MVFLSSVETGVVIQSSFSTGPDLQIDQIHLRHGSAMHATLWLVVSNSLPARTRPTWADREAHYVKTGELGTRKWNIVSPTRL